MGLALVACGDNAILPIDAGHPLADTSTADSTVGDSSISDGTVAIDSSVADGSATAAGSRVWVVGDFVTNNVTEAGDFNESSTLPVVPGDLVPSTATVSTAELADSDAYTANVFDVSADGTQTAFVADATTAGQFELFLAGPTGNNPQALVTAGLTGATVIKSIAFSPDGSKIAYLADGGLGGSGAFDLYVVTATAGSIATQVSPARPLGTVTANKLNVLGFQWSTDSRYLAFDGDLDTDGTNEMYIVDTTAALPQATKLLATTDINAGSGTKGVSGLFAFDKQDNVYFRAHVSPTNTQFQLFQGTPAGARNDLSALAGTRTADHSVADFGTFGIENDGETLVFSADTPVAGIYNLYAHGSADSTTVAAPALTGFVTTGGGTTSGPDFFTPFAFSPDGTTVAVTSSWTSTRHEPWVVALNTTTNSQTRLVDVLSSCVGSGSGSGSGSALCSSPDVSGLQWTGDGSDVFVIGDITSNNDTKAYKLDPTQADQAPTLAVDVPTSGDMINLIVRPSH